MKTFFLVLLTAFIFCSCNHQPEISGEQMTWHKITLTFNGPESSETADPNPFMDYRLTVAFTQGEQTFIVPGYYAADGNAEYTSAEAGNKWRAHFTPPAPGEWNYEVSFVQGTGVAINHSEGESAGYMDGATGSFIVEETNKTGRDFRARGRLTYVGEHYLKAAKTGEYFLKCGADAPENLLAYYEFDYTPNVGDRLKKWEDHAQDYNEDATNIYGEPTNKKAGTY